MAKKNKKKKGNIPLPAGRQEQPAASAAKNLKPKTHPSQNAVRETFESLAIAFILAFLIRTFVVEPFVIPTGSMSPALRGVHMDLNCAQCGHRYRVNASQERNPAAEKCVGGMCPMCRYTMAYNPDLRDAPKKSASEPSYSGDRIIVNKFLYSFSEPQRWDVVVFKFPGNATQNYIKRLVGLPEETLEIFGGDLFVKPDSDTEYTIARKPPHIAYAMRQEVHDNHRNPQNLHDAGWPFRWQADEGWQVESVSKAGLTRRKFVSNQSDETWLRYYHTVPDKMVWPMLEEDRTLPKAAQHLISDFNPYNTRITREAYDNPRDYRNPFVVPDEMTGLHWVGDLYVEADVDVTQSGGELLLELVESGHRFRATIDLDSGVATLGILPRGAEQTSADFSPKGQTPLRGVSNHRVVFGNVDDQLLLWVDDKLVEFDTETTYDWESRFGVRQECLPFTSDDDPGDLAPARVATRKAAVAIERLQIERDIYYIADKRDWSESKQIVRTNIVSDYPYPPSRNPTASVKDWDVFATRQTKPFRVDEDQFFVMGDNSPQSSDSRLWNFKVPGNPSKPGGSYLERQLMIGRAVSVVWPHMWNYTIPGFEDMRRIQ